MEGLEILKPMVQQRTLLDGISGNGNGFFPGGDKQTVVRHGGVNMEVDVVACGGETDNLPAEWMVENLKFSVTEPVR